MSIFNKLPIVKSLKVALSEAYLRIDNLQQSIAVLRSEFDSVSEKLKNANLQLRINEDLLAGIKTEVATRKLDLKEALDVLRKIDRNIVNKATMDEIKALVGRFKDKV